MILKVSDYCLTNKGDGLKKIKIVRITQFEKTIKTYNLSKISNSSNYFVNSILVNNEDIDELEDKR
ncbi:hypothetical protein CJ739_1752 [Mariniflexile rhizosphaerae]|nr:hypothetical protein CJ739_1752 [Mariniflexile sp. TRM1-10]